MDELDHSEHIAVRALERINDGFLILDRRFTVVYANPEVQRLTGRTGEPVLGSPLWSAFPEIRGSTLEGACRRALHTQEATEAEISVSRDGRRFKARCYPDGDHLYIHCSDVTEWRLHQLTQAAERRWLRLIVQGRSDEELTRAIVQELEAMIQFGAAATLWVTEDRLRPISAGERLAHMVRQHETLMRLDSVWSPAAAAVFESCPVAVPDIELETRWKVFRVAARAAGFRSCCIQPVTDPQGIVVGAVALYMDYGVPDPTPYLNLAATAARTWGAALQRQGAATYLHLLGQAEGEAATAETGCGGAADQQLLKQRDRIVMMGSHELRNGLAAVQGALDLLTQRSQMAEALPSSDVIRIAQRAQRAMGYLMNLFESTLHSATDRSGDARPVAPVDLAEIVTETVCRYQTVSDSHTIRLRRSVQHAWGRWDALRLRHMLGNLLSNAVKYSPDHSTIEVSLSVEDDHAVVSVQDQGIGIPEDDLAQIFLPYHRGRNVGDKPGTGIGLALVREVVEGYGGTVSVTANRPHGTTFTVRLPLEGHG